MVIFLTDGRPTIGTTDEDQIVANVKKENDGRTRIFCFGIGTDVNTHLLDRITEDTRAASQYVLPEEDLEVKVSSFFTKIKEPVLANPDAEVHRRHPRHASSIPRRCPTCSRASNWCWSAATPAKAMPRSSSKAR